MRVADGRLRRELRRVRSRDWAAVVDELEVGLTSPAAPVRGGDGSLAAMVGVSGPSFRLDAGRRRQVLPHVLSAAAGAGARLARRGG
ncbi:MAG: hypothetical protein OEW31_01610 [Thermoleophilia bacterium]|nr:hypothetical protein [Thermoleophilia bacterium]MDH5332302.1 hypothetical protein [Thermoleophilia bacterium]